MRVLWVSLVEFPPLSTSLGKSVVPSCGWLWSSAKAIIQFVPNLEMGVIIYSYGKKYEKHRVDGISYYMIPSKSMRRPDKNQIGSCKKAIIDFQPDLIHIHGTEHSLALAVCRANIGQIPIVANIQGLAGAYAQYADGGLNAKDMMFNMTPLDFFRDTLMLRAQQAMAERAESENEVIRSLTDVIGRTQWDHDNVVAINQKIRYHFMNETLRDSFYEEPVWHYANCRKHTIFVSNSGVPLKGAHQVLKALPIILRAYPDAQVNFCGSSVMNNDWKSIIHFQGYHLYLRRLVKRLHLQANVKFLGTLTEQQMKQAYLNANVYVMPSAIENSPNSLCEAQTLGVPTVASYVGGVPSLVEDGCTGYLYRYEEINMLAQIIIRLFSQTDFRTLSQNEQEIARKRHDKERNAERLLKIYQRILNYDINA